MDEDAYRYIRPLDCYSSHDAEIIFVGPVDSAAYPSDDEWEDFVNDLCVPVFEGYVGTSYSASALDISYVVPMENGWNNGDHMLICYVYDDTGSVSTPLQGSGR